MTELGKDVRFFVEEAKAGDRRPERLQEVLNGQTLELLEQKGWGVSIATLGLENSETADRTGLVLHNAFKGHKNVPFTLWIAGCEGDYWTDPLRDPTLGKTKAKIAQAESWADYYRIPVSGIGLDIEPSLGESREMNKGLRNLGIGLEKNTQFTKDGKAFSAWKLRRKSFSGIGRFGQRLRGKEFKT